MLPPTIHMQRFPVAIVRSARNICRCGGALGCANSVNLNKFPIFIGTNRTRDLFKNHVAFGMPGPAYRLNAPNAVQLGAAATGPQTEPLDLDRFPWPPQDEWQPLNRSARFLMAALLFLAPVANQVDASQ